MSKSSMNTIKTSNQIYNISDTVWSLNSDKMILNLVSDTWEAYDTWPGPVHFRAHQEVATGSSAQKQISTTLTSGASDCADRDHTAHRELAIRDTFN